MFVTRIRCFRNNLYIRFSSSKRHWHESITRLTHALVSLEDSKKPETSDRRNCIAPRIPVGCIEIAVRVSWSMTRTYLLHHDFVHRRMVLVDHGNKVPFMKDSVEKLGSSEQPPFWYLIFRYFEIDVYCDFFIHFLSRSTVCKINR